MATAQEHYASHLARIYVWMAGGISAAPSAGEADLRGLTAEPGLAVDLGAGFGMHSIPLARAGHQVLAVDSSAHLLAELSALADGLPVEAKCVDFLSFPELLPVGAKPQLVLCMGGVQASPRVTLDSRTSRAPGSTPASAKRARSPAL